ncbi:MAG TPA: universal stress protein [Gammaproteobacteria bacterium]|nr:universal stress protein [Gammaproteobacteria bacterium]
MYKNILVTIDLAEESSWRRALPVAVELAEKFGGKLHVATVVRDIDALLKTQYSLLAYEKLIAEAEQRVAAVVVANVPPELEPSRTIGQGSIYAEILRIARATNADLIVMASHRPAMKDYLIGANAARVVRHARCSVLVVREP